MNRDINNIMIVDDGVENLRVLSRALTGRGYRVRALPDGELALKAASIDPPDLFLLDIDMPCMDGFQVCEALKSDSRLEDIPVLFISAMDGAETKIDAFNHGGLDFITKPYRFEEVDARVRTHLTLRRLQLELREQNEHLEDLVSEKVEEISKAQMATIFALAKLAESRDDDTGKHIERVSEFCRALAEQLHKDGAYNGIDDRFISNLHQAAPLHDIGKVGISDSILLKPGKLTNEEFDTIKTHTLIGAQTLEAVQERYPGNGFIRMGVYIAKWHHEKWNGKGYPDGLSVEEIPLSARIMAMADVYDALRSKRPYKKPFSHEKARDIIVSDSGTHFDPRVVEAFQKIESRFETISKQLME